MILGYDSPVTDPATGISYNGTVVTSLAGLKDGRPGTRTVVEYPAAESPLITVNWGFGITPRVAAVINLTLPTPGTVTATWLEPVTLDPMSSQTRPIVDLPNGERGVIFVFDAGLPDAGGITFEIEGQSVPAESEVSIGEVWASDAADLAIRSTWSDGITQPPDGVSINGSLYRFPDQPRRQLDVDVVPQAYERAFLQQQALQDIRAAIARDPRVLAIPDATTQQTIDRTGRYARVTEIGPITGERAGRYFSMRLQTEEMVG